MICCTMRHADQKDERDADAIVQLWIDGHELEKQHDEQYGQKTILHLGSKKRSVPEGTNPFSILFQCNGIRQLGYP